MFRVIFGKLFRKVRQCQCKQLYPIWVILITTSYTILGQYAKILNRVLASSDLHSDNIPNLCYVFSFLGQKSINVGSTRISVRILDTGFRERDKIKPIKTSVYQKIKDKVKFLKPPFCILYVLLDFNNIHCFSMF